MKKKMFMALAVILAVGISNQLIAQETITKQKTKSNNANEKTIDQSTSVCVGKIRCGDGSCTIDFDQEIVSPRDAATGLPTGKRMHKPFVITMELDKSTPAPVRESPSKASTEAVRESPTKASTGKVSYSDLSVMVTSKGKSKKLPVTNNQITLPDDCDDDCDLVVSWSWGETQQGTSTTGAKGSGISRYQATFNLEVKEGEFMASKHKKSGHVSLLK